VPSWRDEASESAQQDLDALLAIALPFAQQELVKHGEFYPFAAAIDRTGKTEMIALQIEAGEKPQSAQVMAECVQELARRRTQIRAGAVVVDVRLPDTGGDAISVELEHAEGQAITVLLPYRRRGLRQTIEYAPMRAEAGQRRIWAPS